MLSVQQWIRSPVWRSVRCLFPWPSELQYESAIGALARLWAGSMSKNQTEKYAILRELHSRHSIRLIDIFLRFLSVFGKLRIVRDCGYVHDEHDDRECFRRTGTFEVESIFCSCTGDLCNSTPASTHQSVFGVTIYIMIAALPFLVSSATGKLCSFRRLLQ